MFSLNMEHLEIKEELPLTASWKKKTWLLDYRFVSEKGLKGTRISQQQFLERVLM